MCGSLVYLPPIILPPRWAENLGRVRFFWGGVHKLRGPKLAQFLLVGAAGIRSGASWAVFGRSLAFLLAVLESGDSILEVWDVTWSISQGVGGLAEPFK